MDLPADQIDELRALCERISCAAEAGFVYLLLADLQLPPAAVPRSVDALLCPMPRDGYSSRLFYSDRVTCPRALNWNGNVRVLERNWVTFSWQTPPEMRLAQMVATHLKAFR